MFSTTVRKQANMFVKKVGNYFKFDAHYFLKNSFIVSLSHSVAILKGIVTSYLVTRLFPTAMYGEFKFVTSIVGIVGIIALSGLPPVLARVIAKKDQHAPIMYTLRWYSMLCAIGALTLLLSIPFLSYWHRENLWPLFVIAALLFVPNNVSTTFFGGYITGSGKFGTSLKASVLGSILQIIFVLTMLLVHPSSTILMALTTGIPVLIYLWYLRNLHTMFPSEKKSWTLLRQSVHLTIADLPMSLSWYIDGLLISAFFGINQLAIFSVALLLPENVKIFCKELTPIAFSKQAHGTNSLQRRKHLAKVVWLSTLVFAVGALMYCALTPWIIPILFPQYPSNQVIPITNIAALTLVTIPSSLFAQHLEARGLIDKLRNAQWISSAIFIIALFWLIPKYGLPGAIVARGFFRFSLGGLGYYFMMQSYEETVA